MVISAEYGVLVVSLWLLVACAFGVFAVLGMMRRQVILMTPIAIAFSMAAGGILLFPATYLNHPIVNLLKLLILFLLADLLLLTLSLKISRKPVRS